MRVTLREARDGNFNAKLNARVLKFLKDLDRDDITIQKLSNVSVNWTVDVGKTDLNFEFSTTSEKFSITVKDGKNEKVESWSGELQELQMDLDDTLEFIDEFKNSLNTSINSAAKNEGVEDTEKSLNETVLNEADDDKLIVAYEKEDAEKKLIEVDNEVLSVEYDSEKSNAENIAVFKELAKEKGLSDEDISKLKFKKVKAKSLKEHLVEDGIIEKASVEAVLTYGVSQGVIATFTKLEDDIFKVTFDASENYGLFDEPEATAKTIIIDLLNKTSTAYNYVDTTFVAEEDGFVTVQVVIDVNSDLIDSL